MICIVKRDGFEHEKYYGDHHKTSSKANGSNHAPKAKRQGMDNIKNNYYFPFFIYFIIIGSMSCEDGL